MADELTGQVALAAKLAAVIHEFCEDLPWAYSERIGAEAARAAWDAGSGREVASAQVFLAGDVLPQGVAVLNTSGVLYGPAPGWVLSVPGVAIPLPTATQVETLVEQAQDQREAA